MEIRGEGSMNDLTERMERTRQAAEQLAREQDITLSLIIEDLSNGHSVQFNEAHTHSSASTIKTILLMAALEDEGVDFSLSDMIELSDENSVDFSVVTQMDEKIYSIHEYLQWMILESCNASTNVIIDLLGYDRINQVCRDLGMKETVVQRKMMDTEARARGQDNLTSARDMAILYKTIYHKQYFNPKACDKGIAILSRCRDRKLLRRFLPQELTFAHKSGGLDEVSHDVGIFFDPDVLVSAFTTSLAGEEMQIKREQTIGHIGRWLLKEEI